MDFWRGLADRLVRWRWPLFVGAVLVTAMSIAPASRLQFEQSVEAFYAPDSVPLQNYLESKRLFGGDEFVIVAWDAGTLFTPDGRLSEEAAEHLQAWSATLGAIPGVDAASTQHLGKALTLDRVPILAAQRDQLLELLEGLLVGEDRRTTAIVLRLQGEADSAVPRRETIERIRAAASRFPMPTYIVGEPVQINDTFVYIEQDGAVLGWASTAALTLVVILIFRRLRWVLMPLLVVEMGILWTKATLVLADFQLSMVSSVTSSLLTVVGIATVMHLIVRFREQRVHHEPRAAARATFSELAHPIFWTSATTAAGFGAQLTSHVAPVQSFGLMTAIGTMVVLLAVIAIVPGVLLFGRHRPVEAAGERRGMIERGLAWTSHWVEGHPVPVTIVALLLVAGSVSGLFRLQVETDFSRNFRAGTPIVEGLRFVETRLGGAGVWEVNFPAPAELDGPFLDRVRRLTERLRTLELEGRPAVTKAVSLTDGLDLIAWLPLAAKRALLRQFQPELEPNLYSAEHQRMRIVLRARERQQSADRLRTIAEVERVAREEFPQAKASGIFVLLTFLVDSLLNDQWVSLLVGALLIISLMTVAFRSWRIGLVSLIPNLIPIVLVIGTMGWLGIPINIGTAMISSVSLGLTVDSSIHYFSGFRRARQRGVDRLSALRETNQGVGIALIYTNLALIAGFLALTLSHFIPLVYFGVLVSLAMFGGLIGNLILLPLLIRGLRIE